MSVAQQYIYRSRFEARAATSEPPTPPAAMTPPADSPNVDAFFSFFEEDEDNQRFQNELELNEFQESLRAEIDIFKKYLFDKSFTLRKDLSTRDFRFDHTEKFPLLSELSLVLLSIPSSGAMIERFYNCCGIISDKFDAIRDELFEYRAMFRGNLHVLDEMNAD
jgi:hypothetical protein